MRVGRRPAVPDKRDVVEVLREAIRDYEDGMRDDPAHDRWCEIGIDDARRLLALVEVGEDVAMSDYACAASADGCCEFAAAWRRAKEAGR
jgi:hypothetical protein